MTYAENTTPFAAKIKCVTGGLRGTSSKPSLHLAERESVRLKAGREHTEFKHVRAA